MYMYSESNPKCPIINYLNLSNFILMLKPLKIIESIYILMFILE